MAWANHSRCLQCGARLALYRKLTDGEFCSAVHRKAFQDDQCRLAMARLMETQQACRRVTDEARKQADLELAMDSPPPPADALPMAVQPQVLETRMALDPLAYDAAGDPVLPHGVNAAAAVELSLDMAGRTPLPLVVAKAMPAAGAPSPQALAVAAQAPLLPGNSRRAASAAASLSQHGEIRPLPQIDPAENRRATAPLPQAIFSGSRTWLPLPAQLTASPAPPMSLARGTRLYNLALVDALPGTLAAAKPAPVAYRHGQIALPEAAIAQRTGGLALRSTQLAANSVAVLTPAAAGAAAAPHTLQATALAVSTAAVSAGIERPHMPVAPAGECTLARGVHVALPLVEAIAPPPAAALTCAEEHPSIPVHKPEFRLAPASVQLPWAKMRALPMPVIAAPRTERNCNAPAAQAFVSNRAFPRTCFTPQPVVQKPFEQPAWTEPQARPVSAPRRRVGEFVRDTPLSLRLMAMMIPVLLFIALRPAPAPTQAAARPDAVSRFVDARLTAVRAAIQNRAGIELLDDFRSGLDNWESRRDAAVQWSYDQTGFVKPGALAVYKPSLGLSDYNVEFLGQIDHKALSWVFRAADPENYQVAKLVLLKAGPLPTLGVVRYAVIDGKEGPHTSATLPLNVHGDTMYRVRLEARGSDFALYVQNQLVHFWSDARLKTGGVGFFSAKGEQSRIRWVQVSHQYDAIGRLCAYFRPFAMAAYNLQPTNGSWK